MNFISTDFQHTDGKTGILILFLSWSVKYLSSPIKPLMTKLKKAPGKTWLKNNQRYQNKDFTQGLINAIHLCGNILEPHFPIQPNDINELKKLFNTKE